MASAPGGLLRATGLAALTGMRTFVTPALLCRRMLPRGSLRAAATLLAAAELIGDKLPHTPNRTAPLGLTVRILCGAGVARAMLHGRRRHGRAAAAGALVFGAAVAVLGAFAGLRARLALTRRLGGGAWANVIAGVIEDAALVTVGTATARGR